MKSMRKVLFLVLALALVIGTLVVVSSAEGEESANVAKIGTNEYASLYDAFAAATDGDTITLIADTTETKSIVLDNKTVTLDLGGHSVGYTDVLNGEESNKFLFYLGVNGKLNVVGAGSFRCGNAPLFFSGVGAENAALEGVELTIGDGTNTVIINDNNVTKNPSYLFGMASGDVTLNKVNLTIGKMTANWVYAFGQGKVRFNNCSSIIGTTGTTGMIIYQDGAAWGSGRKLDFEATNSTFEMKVTADDVANSMGDSTAQGKCKSVFFKTPSYTLDNATAIGPATGSSVKFTGCKIFYKWRAFVQDGKTSYPTDMLTVQLDNCEWAQGGVSTKTGRGWNRGVNVTYKNCKIDDTNISDYSTGITGNTITFTGVTQCKWGVLSTAKGVWDEGVKMQYVKADTTGYPFHLSTETFNAGETIAFSTLVNLNFSLDDFTGGPAAGAYASFFSGKIGINNKVGSTSKEALTATSLTTTANASNRYFRFYSVADAQAAGVTDAYMDFIVSPSKSSQPFDQYQYFTWDFDLMTDTNYISKLNCACIGRNASGGSALSNNQAFWIETETSGAHKGETYFQFNGKKLYVGKDSYDWHHITVIVNVAEYDATSLQATRITLRTYVDGTPISSVCDQVNENATTYINGFRFTYSTGKTVAAVDDAICMDNVTIRAFNRVDAASDSLACFFQDDNTTLIDGAYVGYNAQYELPEKAPVAKVGVTIFDTLQEAYNYVVANGGEIELLRNTAETVDIKTNVTIKTNGIEFVPTDDSWGFKREGEGTETKYIFDSTLTPVSIYWYLNPFDTDEFEGYYAETSVKSGLQITPPDDNRNYLEKYGTINDDGSVTVYQLKGWVDNFEDLEDEDAVITTLPVANSKTRKYLYYWPVYEETTIAATDVLYTKTATIQLDYGNVDEDNEEVKDFSTVLAAGTELTALINDFGNNNVEGATYTLMKDIVDQGRKVALFSIKTGATTTFDLNGHKIVFSPDGKYNHFEVGGGTTLIVTSSKEGALIENRPYDTANKKCPGGTGVFSAFGDATLKVVGNNNLTVRGVIMQEVGGPATISYENTVFQQVWGDSYAMFMVRVSGSNAANITMKGCTIYGVSSGQKDIFDIGGGAKSATGVKVVVEDTKICYQAGDGKGGCIVNRFPAGAQISLKNVTGNYFAQCANGNDGLHSGVITVNEGCTFNADIGSCATLAEGVVVARGWWKSEGQFTFLNYNVQDVNAEANVNFKVDCKVRYGTVKAENACTVTWYTDEAKTEVVGTGVWVKGENYFFQNNVPGEKTEEGVTYSHPNDTWVMFEGTTESDTCSYAPDMTKWVIKSVTGMKQNVKLYSDFQLNLFIPKVEGMNLLVKVGETVLKDFEIRNIDGKDYFVVTVAKNADEAADVVTYDISYVGDEKKLTQTVQTAVALYATALKTAEDGAYVDLANAMLTYAKAAYVQANGTEGMPTILANATDAAVAAKAEAVNTVSSAAITGASYALTDKPVFVLALSAEFEGTISVKVGGKTYTKEVLAGTASVDFSEIKLYDFTKEFEIFVGEDSVGKYNISAYYAAQEDATVKTLVDALYAYSVAADEYINPVE